MKRLVALLLLAGCGGSGDAGAGAEAGGEGAGGGRSLPPLALQPRLAELEAIAAEAAPPPDEAEREELAELVEASFSSRSSREMQAEALRWLLESEHARSALERGLSHPEPGVRWRCAYHLGRLGERAAIPPLLWRERQEVEPEPVCWVIGALDALGNRSALPRLASMLTDPRFQETAVPVADAVLAAAERQPEERTWASLAAALERLHEEWLARRAEPAANGSPEIDPELRARLAGLLAGLQGFQLKPVDEARTAFTRLSRVPERLLRLALTAEETYLRVHAVEIVRDLGRAAAPLGEDLLALLADPAARLYAVEALGEVGHAPALPFLLEHLQGRDPELRVAAASALGPLGEPAALEPLRRVLADEAELADVRVRAAFSLALLTGGAEGEGWLRERLEREDYHGPTLRELLARLESEG